MPNAWGLVPLSGRRLFDHMSDTLEIATANKKAVRKTNYLPHNTPGTPLSPRNTFAAAIEHEFCQGSAIAPSLYQSAVQIVADVEIDAQGNTTTPIHDALNWKFTRFGYQVKPTQYAALLLNEDGSVHQAKLANPLTDGEGKLRRYEAPKGGGSRAYFPAIPPEIAAKVAERYNCDVISEGFWKWLKLHPEIPIIITEGDKKALSLLSQGYVAISLYGVNAGYRSKDTDDNKCKPYLIPDLLPFATEGRAITLAFDSDEKASARARVQTALSRFGQLLSKEHGCKVSIAQWDSALGKGIDDVIAANGADECDRILREALPFQGWRQQQLLRDRYGLNVEPSIVSQGRYLPQMPLPSNKLILLKAPKGTGKSTLNADWAAPAITTGRRVLLLTHREQLGRKLAKDLGITYNDKDELKLYGKYQGLALCVDSLRKGSLAQFSAEGWQDALIIIDECESVLWHLLASSTCTKERVPILRELQALLKAALSPDSEGQVILSDADLSNYSLDFVRGLAGRADLAPYLIRSDWLPESPGIAYSYETPEQLAYELQRAVKKGKHLILSSGQKASSKWGTKNLEEWLLIHTKGRKRILRIDSESVADPNHPAYRAVERINAVMKEYDIIICSPTIESGVSIDLYGHFSACWAFFTGVLPENSARQFLARLRDRTVPRHIYAAERGCNFAFIGNGSTSPKQLLESQQRKGRQTLQQLRSYASDFEIDEDGTVNGHEIALTTYGKIGARINAGSINYRDSILAGLKDEGYHIQDCSLPEALKEKLKGLNLELKDLRDAFFLEECIAIADSPIVSKSEYEALSKKKEKSQSERHQERAYALNQRYAVPLTPELIERDSDGFYPQILLHYLLTCGNEFLGERDKRKFEEIARDGKAWLPDLNRRSIGVKVQAAIALGIDEILRNPGKHYTSDSPEIQRIAKAAKECARDVKLYLGVSAGKGSAMGIANNLLDALVGIRMKEQQRGGSDGNRKRSYAWHRPDDGRAEIFTAWLDRDRKNQAANEAKCSVESVATGPGKTVSSCDTECVHETPNRSNTAKTGRSADLPQPAGSTTQSFISPETPSQSEGRRLYRWGKRLGEWWVAAVNGAIATAFPTTGANWQLPHFIPIEELQPIREGVAA